jgi:opacity protein-like surface antigen
MWQLAAALEVLITRRQEKLVHTKVKTYLHIPAWGVIILLVAAPHAGLAADADLVTDVLTTQAESRLSIGLSSYDYHEPIVPMPYGTQEVKIYGLRGGIGYYGTRPLAESFFGLVEIDYSFGSVEYAASEISGSARSEGKGIPDYYLEGKIAVGQDFTFDSFVLSPYVGLGYRRLFNEMSSLSSAYDRTQEYFYLPVGLIHRFSLGSDGMLETTVEGDFLLAGYHKAEFSDFVSSWEDANFKQASGYGIKASMIYRKGNLGIGPYLNYWNIADSDTDNIQCDEVMTCETFEPANSTIEYGMKVQLSSLALPAMPPDRGRGNRGQNWLGFYAGIQGAYLAANVDMSSDFLSDGTFLFDSASQFSGAAIGVYAGSNLYSSSNVVVGIEADANLTNASLSGDPSTFNGELDSDLENFYDLKGYGSGRLRAGYSYGRIMPYITAGLAIANTEVGSGFTDTTDAYIEVKGSSWLYGYTLGAGADYQLDDRLRLRAEYRFTDYIIADIDTNYIGDDDFSYSNEVDLYSQSLLLGMAISF